MSRIFVFLLLVLLLGFGFAWFADRPGEVVLEWQGTQYQTSLMVVVVGVAAIVATAMFAWWIGRTILDSPKIMQRFWSNRKKDRGYRALSMGLIAANSGDAAAARRFTKDSIKLLGQEPLVGLLDAQTSLLEGKREEARNRFEKMLDDDDTRFVALRGLFLEAERQKAGEAARHYAEEAHKAAPNLPWAANAKLRYASQEGDWASALATLETNRSAGLIDKETAKRQRAVLLTARAMQEEPADPVAAARTAREAHRLAPDLVPAAVIGAKALARNNDLGRAAGMLETVWKKQPHPEIAQAYIHLRMGDSALDRMKRARKLASWKPNNPEGNYAIAEAAMEAQDWEAAREAMAPLLVGAPAERACLIMADLEEGEFGDKGRMRDWLARAVRAPRDAVWTADGVVSEQWLPISPVSGRIDAFEWKVPVERLGSPQTEVYDAEELEALVRAPVSEAVDKPVERESAHHSIRDKLAAAIGLSTDVEEAEIVDEQPEKKKDTIEAEDASTQNSRPVDAADENANLRGKEEAVRETDAIPVAKATTEESTALDEAKKPDASAVDKDGNRIAPPQGTHEESKADQGKKNASPAGEGKNIFALDRRPDDPGISDEREEAEPKKFGIF
jgi:HemY protein